MERNLCWHLRAAIPIPHAGRCRGALATSNLLQTAEEHTLVKSNVNDQFILAVAIKQQSLIKTSETNQHDGLHQEVLLLLALCTCMGMMVQKEWIMKQTSAHSLALHLVDALLL